MYVVDQSKFRVSIHLLASSAGNAFTAIKQLCNYYFQSHPFVTEVIKLGCIMILYVTAQDEVIEEVFVSAKNCYVEGFVAGLVNELKWEYNELLDGELVCYFIVS